MIDEHKNLLIGLVPALRIEEEIAFRPFTLIPLATYAASTSAIPDLITLASRYHEDREASLDHQAVLYAERASERLIAVLWPILVFAHVSWARRSMSGNLRGVPFPEQFFVPSVTFREGRVYFGTGRTEGSHRAEGVPLPWPVDCGWPLRDDQCDLRLRLACEVVASDPERFENSVELGAIGAAADLANASLETQSQKISNAAPATRAFTLICSAFEGLHRKGSDEDHRHREVCQDASRLRTTHDCLSDLIYSKRSAEKRPPQLVAGTSTSRVSWLLFRLFWIRNQLAHGRAITDSDFFLPPELNKAPVRRAATKVLAALLGQDLLEVVDVGVPFDGMRIPGADFSRIFPVSPDAKSLDDELADTLCPRGDSDTTHRPGGSDATSPQSS